MRRVRSLSKQSARAGRAESGRIVGFPPVVRSDARVLILGSMPSVASLERQQYYGLPRNAFWSIMASLFGVSANRPYEERLAALMENRIALWDVIRSCHRPGSLDSSIATESAEPNDFENFFKTNTGIARVFFNGRKAEQMFNSLVIPCCAEAASRSSATLPSTSPAHAAMNFSEKLKRWTAVRLACELPDQEMR